MIVPNFDDWSLNLINNNENSARSGSFAQATELSRHKFVPEMRLEQHCVARGMVYLIKWAVVKSIGSK